ncbi:uncharacterized protein LOC117292725 [Asterias rubens]|uniref:uncharacterized protein LOC117292725 n=1 Tax=Asterias rubens TaxID=7604 RepID=UPI001455B3E6|nr:uncharacterized protein LOC117292725 [Asterias rubens]
MEIPLHAARLVFLLWIVSKTQGMVCWMGQEPDLDVPHKPYRWVIPVEDPCMCTQVRPGGITNRTPNRHFKVIYFDTVLISNSPVEIHKWLQCPDNQDALRVNTQLTSPLTETVSTISAPVEPTDASSATGAKTTAIPFTCDGKSDGNYADTTDCGMYYVCSFSNMFHRPCASGTYFSPELRVCVFLLGDVCNSKTLFDELK